MLKLKTPDRTNPITVKFIGIIVVTMAEPKAPGKAGSELGSPLQ
jgi:hypothetical protein